MATGDAGRIFTGIARSYDRVATVLSFGQDPRWRAALVDAIDARPDDRVLDVATGTGMVAEALRRRYGCHVVGLDQSADMLTIARTRDDVYDAVVEGRAERLPFPDASFDHLTFTYLLRYVDDVTATLAELARVVRPGGRIGMVEFGVPSQPMLRGLWRWYTRFGLPLVGSLVSPAWLEVGRFLGPNIEEFFAREPDLAGRWRDAGIKNVQARAMSFGAGLVMWGVRA